jgi:sn-glycerol 3-phosphate transport system substrate-binding protein
MPYNGEKGWTGNLIGGGSLWLMGGLDTVTEDGALAFLEFLNNPEHAAEWHKITGYLPITAGAQALLEEEGWYETNPNYQTAYDQINDTTVTIATQGAMLGTFRETRDILTQAIEEILAGADPKARLDQATTDANKLLADYNLLYSEE